MKFEFEVVAMERQTVGVDVSTTGRNWARRSTPRGAKRNLRRLGALLERLAKLDVFFRSAEERRRERARAGG